MSKQKGVLEGEQKLLDILLSADPEKLRQEDAEFHVKDELYNLQSTINLNEKELSAAKRKLSQQFQPNKDGSFKTTDWSTLASDLRTIDIKEDLIQRLRGFEKQYF